MFIAGALLRQPRAALTILSSQKADTAWFQQPVTHAVLAAVYALVKANTAIEPASVLAEIKAQDAASTVTLDDLTHCMKLASNPANLLHHVCQIKDRRDRQELRQIADVLIQEIEGNTSTAEVFDHANWLLHQLREPAKNCPDDVIAQTMAKFRQSAESGYSGLPSRWYQLQKIAGGYAVPGVTILSGLSKHGKTSCAANETLYGGQHGIRTLFISLEMREGEIRALMAGDDCDIDLFKLRTGVVQGDERQEQLQAIHDCMIRHKDLPITIIDGSKSIEELDSLIRGAAGEFDRVVIDHLHLIRHSRRDPVGKEERLSHYSNTIRNSTNDANLNTLLLAQLSREGLVDRHGDPVAPDPRHLKGSGSIEQDATQVIFVYQDPAAGKEMIWDKAPTIIKVAYNRFGPTGRDEFVFWKSRQKLIPRTIWDEHHLAEEEKEWVKEI